MWVEADEKHDLLGRGRESHVFGLGGRKCNVVLQLAGPRDRATRHHRDEAGARAAVNTIKKGEILQDGEFGRDDAREIKVDVNCAREIAENAFSLFPMASCRGGHM